MKPLTEIRELFFIVSPPPHIRSDVSVLKDDVQYLVGRVLEDRYSKAYISLFKFDDQENMDGILQFVETRAAHFKPFNIFIKNLNLFHHGSNRTIFLDIVNKYSLREVFERLVKEDINFTPHITIAKNMIPEEFIKTWLYLKDFKYSQHFLCDRITVLAREGRKWEHYKDIMFGGSHFNP